MQIQPLLDPGRVKSTRDNLKWPQFWNGSAFSEKLGQAVLCLRSYGSRILNSES